jgi:hypothetical protein
MLGKQSANIGAQARNASGHPGRWRKTFSSLAAQKVFMIVDSNWPKGIVKCTSPKEMESLTNFEVGLNFLKNSNKTFEREHPPSVHGAEPLKKVGDV